MNIGEVGASRPMTEADVARRVVAISALLDIHPRMRLETPVFDAIKLPSRDFLTEHRTYDLVIVHSIFHVRGLTGKDMGGNSPDAESAISPHHSVAAWKQRLASTRARYIVVCGGMLTLDGWNLGELDGYVIAKRDGKITVYETANP